MYDELEYWGKRECPNSASDRDTQSHRDFTKKHLRGCKKILAFGVGVGRMFPAFSEVTEVIGYDISEKYKEEVIKYAEEMPFKYTHIVEDKIKELPFDDGEFDAVVCVSVLLHQRPTNIERVMKEVARVGKKTIVVSYYECYQPFSTDLNTALNNYCFNHNYEYLCKINDWTMKDKLVSDIERQIYFVYY